MRRWYFALLGGLFSLSVYADTSIPVAYYRIAKESEIPVEILYAMARTESRRLTSQGIRPWPWTLNIAGEGHYFEDKLSAFRTAKAAVAEGQSVDIGLMQISWRYHQDRFTSMLSAFDPYENLRVGAKILLEYIDQSGSLWSGIGRYHSGNQDKASPYQSRVAEQLVKVLEDSALDDRHSIHLAQATMLPVGLNLAGEQRRGWQ